MKRSTCLISFCLFVLLAVPSWADSAGPNQSTGTHDWPNAAHASYGNYVAANRNIKSIPLLQRPNRPGHFIGNSIRRAYRRRGGR